MPSGRTRDATRGSPAGACVRALARACMHHRSVLVACARIALGSGLIIAALAGAPLVAHGAGAVALRLAVWSLLGGVATAGFAALHAPLLRRPDGTPLTAPGLPNALTLIRLVLIAPVVVLAGAGFLTAAAGVYLVLVLTDIADGIVARRSGPVSEFGVVADPLADVFSTFAIFTVFVVDNLVPVWLYVVLVVRYVMLIAGSVWLVAAFGPIRFRATVPGKVVGVVQALGALLILVGADRGGLPVEAGRALFVFLGLGFASIVMSQAIIGWRHIRRTAPQRVSGRGPSR